jgi:two-component system LytT family sensor kinase
LQPLVENAIRHGIAPRRGPGQVQVRVELGGDRLAIEVLDDGVGSLPDLSRGSGWATFASGSPGCTAAPPR